jgi:hypothetical protein
MRKLERAGLVASDLAVDGRRYRLADPDRVRALLRRYRPPGRLVRGFLEAWEAVGL